MLWEWKTLNGHLLRDCVLPVAICICLVALYIVPQIDLFTKGDYLEFGDFAENALRIRDAKSSLVIYGPFSRYWFHHPGPAFYYLFAAGEYIFHDWLHIVSSAPFSHILMGTIIQCVCAVAAIFYMARRAGGLFVPLAIATLLVHWSLIRGVPTSTWPPDVLFGPFLLLLVFGSGAAAGDSRALPIVILAGGLLVHDHVGQPIQVLPIGAVVIASWFVTARRRRFVGAQPYIVTSVAIGMLFIFPLALDALKGPQSNLATILAHLHDTSGDRHSFRQAIGYFLSFFRYETGQESRQGIASFLPSPYIREYWAWFVLPLFSLLSGIFLLTRQTSLQIRAFVLLVFLATVLSVLWSALIDGPMYDFNGRYFYAVSYAIYLIPLIGVSLIVARSAQWIRTRSILAACLLAILAVPIARKPVFAMAAPSDAFNRELSHLIDGAPVVHLSIDPQRWVSGWGVAVAIDRLGVKFTVNYGYRFLMGDRPSPVSQGAVIPTLRVSPEPCSGGVQVPYFGMERAYVCRP